MNARRFHVAILGMIGFIGLAVAQPPGGGFGGGFGGPPGTQTRKIVAKYDKNGDGWLNKEERAAARAEAKRGGGGRGFGGMGGGENNFKPGPKMEPKDVQNYPDQPLYDDGILRTLFLEFENKDWEAELQDFHGTDVDVPCTMTVDGKKYTNVGVHFRGMSSYMAVPMGGKRSLNLKFHLADHKQNLYGYHTLNLLNCHEDDSFLSSVIYSHISRQYIPAPKANMVRVVINGDCWGVYTNQQQFDGKFLEENYKTKKGARWKIRGNPGARGGLEYIGDDVAAYKRIFEMKTDEDENAWKALIKLCKTLKETPPEKLEEALKPMVDMENLLWFIALDCAVVNDDGYWTRSSDYSIYMSDKGVFHFIPHDTNEIFLISQWGRGGGPGGGGFGGRPGGGMMFAPPAPGEILPAMLRDQLQLTDEQKKQMNALQKETDEKLASILTDEQKKQFKEMKDRPFGMRGPGGMGSPGGGMGARASVTLDPLVGLNNDRFPLRSKVLAVPALRERYLNNMRTIAEKSFDWKTLGPFVANYRALLEKDVEKDTRKLGSYDAFLKLTADEPPTGRQMTIRAFADQRRTYLLEATAKLAPRQ